MHEFDEHPAGGVNRLMPVEAFVNQLLGRAARGCFVCKRDLRLDYRVLAIVNECRHCGLSPIAYIFHCQRVPTYGNVDER